MKVKWIKTQYPGVRYYEHSTRKTGRGQADRNYTIRYTIDGKTKEECLGWASEGWNPEKAHRILSEVKAACKTGEGPQSLAEKREILATTRAKADEEAQNQLAASMTMAEFFAEYYVPRVKLSKRSWLVDEQRIAKEINPILGDIPVRFVRHDAIQQMTDKFAETMAPATVKQYMAIVRQAFRFASETIVGGKPLREGKNPASGLRLPAVLNSRERFLTVEEADKIILSAKKLPSPDLHDAIVLSLNTGMRLGELLRLEWLDVDLAHGIVNVREEEKRKPGGKVPLNNDATTILKARFEMCRDRLLVFPPIYGLMERANLSHAFRKLADEIGINNGVAQNDRKRRVVFHTLRHTFASWLALGGTDIYRIKTLMRHKSIEMTMRYAHLIPDATRDAVHNLRPTTKPSTKDS